MQAKDKTSRRRPHGRSVHDPNDARVRLYVSQRAAEACEYYLMPTEGKFEVDHIVPKARWADYQANNYAALRPRQRVTAATWTPCGASTATPK